MEHSGGAVMRRLPIFPPVACSVAVQAHVHLRLLFREARPVSHVQKPDKELLLHQG